jgi:tetratricopeptide (TPR) repeat protein
MDRAGNIVLSDRQSNAAAAPDSAEPAKSGGLRALISRFMAFLGGLRSWVGHNRTRGIVVAGSILLLIVVTIGGWVYLATIAIHSGKQSVSTAFAALDQRHFNEARNIVGSILRSGRLPRSEYGGPLFVLGAVKTNDAESSPSPERRRIEYLVASRYLKEARAYGMPPDRETQGLYLLGMSLVRSSQFDEGIGVLESLLTDKLPTDEPLARRVHGFLAETCLLMPWPRLEKALEHNAAVLADPKLSPEERADTLLREAECLTRLKRFDDARQALAQIPNVTNRQAAVSLLRGRVTLDELDAALQTVATSDRGRVITEWRPKTDEAVRDLQAAKQLDGDNGLVSRQAGYHLGRAFELQGDLDAALHQFTYIRQLYPESFEAMAANLGEADLLRKKGDLPGAILGYRRVLEPFPGAANYRSDVLPLAKVRAKILAAVSDLVDDQHYADAMVLLDRFTPLFSRSVQLEIKGDTLKQWGASNLGVASNEGESDSPRQQAARHHLRAAGLAYEQLAELRFSSNSYTQDLWKSAENYYLGHSFSGTIRQLKKYLENEPELRNAPALLRLGQAHLALGQVAECIAALEECIELYPVDGSAYQARIDCAKAYWRQGNTERAEQLLRDNIAGSTLKPNSREWKDSLFELGMLLHETNRQEQAIGTLEEAVERYPDDPQALLSKYIIGESYRRWAEELRIRAKESRTISEREKNQQLATAHLTKALQLFEEVQRYITLRGHDAHNDPATRTMLRNCYMLQGTVLFNVGRYKDAIEAYSNVSSLYPDEPFVLETFVQISNCWRRLDQAEKARGAIRQAQIALDRLPENAEFTIDTAFTRDEWRMLLADMGKW